MTTTTEDTSLVSGEIDNHKQNINNWADTIQNQKVPESRKGVNDRFVRDCKQLVAYLDESDSPSSADLVDFEDRHNSLEVQFHQLSDDAQ
jgi:hypothetical protein